MRAEGERPIFSARALSLAGFIAALALMPARAADPAGMVRVPVGGGASIAVPAGWSACDAETRDFLGTKISPAAMQSHCKFFKGGEGVRYMFDPKDGSVLTLTASYFPKQTFSEQRLRDMTPEWLKGFGERMCGLTYRDLDFKTSCVFQVETVGGHPALVGVLGAADLKVTVGVMQTITFPAGDVQVQLMFLPRDRNDQKLYAAMVASIERP